MTKQDKHRERVWAYAHDELEEKERSEIDADAAGNERLQRELTGAAHAHKILTAFMPGVAKSREALDEELDAELFEAWRRSRESPASPAPATPPPAPPAQRRTLRFTYRAALAVAAGLVLAVGLQWALFPVVQWHSDQLIRFEGRGGDAAADQTVYALTTMQTFADALRSGIEAKYEASAPRRFRGGLLRSSPWELQITIREMPRGEFNAILNASWRRKDSGPYEEWSEYFVSPAEYEAYVGTWVGEIVQRLIELSEAYEDGEID